MFKKLISILKNYSLSDYYELKSIVRRAQYESFNHQFKFHRIAHFCILLLCYSLRFFSNKVVDFFALENNNNIDKTIKALPAEYQRWLIKNLPNDSDLKKYKEEIAIFSNKPLISILMPVYNTPEKYLREAIDSILSQVYQNWELCIADDNSSDENTKKILREYTEKDTRIKVEFRSENGHISASSNTTIEMASGEYVSLFDHDDLLTPDALYFVVKYLNLYPKAELIYTDEDKIDDNGYFLEPYFKPDWSPESLMSKNYILHFTTIKTDLIKSVGGFRLGYEGSQDYDLFLRVTEKTKHVYHIPRILYHWRIHQMSTSNNSESKPYAFEAGVKSLQAALFRRNIKGTVARIKGMSGHYSVSYDLDRIDKVSIIITLINDGKGLKKCLDAIIRNSSEFDITVMVDRDSKVLPIWLKEYQKIGSDKLRFVSIDSEISYARQLNMVALKTSGSYLVFLNSEIDVVAPDWIVQMMGQAQSESVGVVGVKIVYPSKHIKHAGVILGINGLFGYAFEGFGLNSKVYMGQLFDVTNYSALSGACIMCKKDHFEKVNGFEERYSNSCYDIDLSLKMQEIGLNNVFLPAVVVISNDPNALEIPKGHDADLFKLKWREKIQNDPCYNRNLTKLKTDFSVAS